MKACLPLCLLLWLTAACTPAAPTLETASPTAAEPPAPSPSPTIVWFPPTPTPTLPPLALDTPLPDALPQKGELVLEDDFSAGKDWQTGQTASSSAAYGNQTLTLAISSGKASVVSFRTGSLPADYYLEINASPSLCRGSDNYGLLLRASSDRDFYRWIITCDGRLRLERLQDGFPAVLKDWTAAVARPGADRLGVWLSGSEMRFYMDGLLQFSAKDPLFTSGSIGLFARSGGEDALTVNFSNLQVWRVAGQPAAAPTPAGSPSP